MKNGMIIIIIIKIDFIVFWNNLIIYIWISMYIFYKV